MPTDDDDNERLTVEYLVNFPAFDGLSICDEDDAPACEKLERPNSQLYEGAIRDVDTIDEFEELTLDSNYKLVGAERFCKDTPDEYCRAIFWQIRQK